MKMHCEQRKVALEVHLLVHKFSDSWLRALKRMKMHSLQRKEGTEVH